MAAKVRFINQCFGIWSKLLIMNDKGSKRYKMYYMIVGDAATQMKPLENIGFGNPVLLKPHKKP